MKDISTKVAVEEAVERLVHHTPRISPDKSNPTETAKFVAQLANDGLSISQAAPALAQIFGLPDSSTLNQMRVACLFTYPALLTAFDKTDAWFIEGRWGLKLPLWIVALQAQSGYVRDFEPNFYNERTTDEEWDVSEHSSWFVNRVGMHIFASSETCELVHWVRNAGLKDTYWILFHAFLFLFVSKMREYEKGATVRKKILHARRKVQKALRK